MEEVGVLAVVKELQSFLGDMNKVNSALNGLRPSGSMLQDMFGAVGEAVSNFGQAVWDVASVTLGVMLRDAIEFIIGQLGDLVQAILESGSAFQLLQIRLNGLNLPQNTAELGNWTSAMEQAKEMTKEQLTWIQLLGAATPFDPATLAEIYTLSRVYGYADEAARRLTTDIANFGAGQALTNADLTTTIQNFGQVIERGKIMMQTIRNLTRSAKLPWNDLLERMAKNTGIAKQKLVELISTPEGISADIFITAFEQLTEEEPRYIGAAGRLARAFVPATQNVKELFTSIFGLNVTVPILDVLGEKVATFTDQFVYFNQQGDLIKTERWDALTIAATNLGKSLSGLISDILGFLPTSSSLADSLVSGVQSLSDWVNTNRDKIVGFFKDVGNTIQTEVVPFIRDQLLPAVGNFIAQIWDNRESILGFFTYMGYFIQYVATIIYRYLVPAFERIGTWVTDNGALIGDFFRTLGSIISYVISQIFGVPAGGEGGALEQILGVIKNFMQYVVDNEDKISELALILTKVFIAVQVLTLVFNIIISVIGTFIGTIVGVLVGIASFIAGVLAAVSAITFIIANFSTLVLIVLGVIGVIGSLITTFFLIPAALSILISAVAGFVSAFLIGFNTLKANVSTTITNIMTDIRNKDWGGVGRDIINGMVKGVVGAAQTLASAAVNAVVNAYNAARRALGIKSPSTLFMDIGKQTMQGMALGIENFAGLTGQAMTEAMTKMAVPAMTMPSIVQSMVAQAGAGNTTNNQSTRNYNLTVHSGASAEPIIQDFNMLSSLSGV